jgi:hypothetical protein
MRKPRTPSPSLVLASLALLVALGGTGYAAVKLPRNSVGSKQVKPNSLKGVDIKETTLQGVVHAKGGSAWAASITLPANTGDTVFHKISKFGRIEGSCATTATGGSIRLRNTSGMAASLSVRWTSGSANAVLQPGQSYIVGMAAGDVVDWVLQTESPRRVISIRTASAFGGSCRHAAIAEIVART